MPAGVYDFDAIAKARAKLNGLEFSGRYFVPDKDGKHSLDNAARRPHPIGRVPEERRSNPVNAKYASTIVSAALATVQASQVTQAAREGDQRFTLNPYTGGRNGD